MEIIDLAGRPELAPRAAEWFASKWGIPAEEYLASMEQSARGGAFPRWYLALDGAGIAGGCGVIENDFHDRRDLAPNLCSLFVEPERRGRGLAAEIGRRLIDGAFREGADVVATLPADDGLCGWYEARLGMAPLFRKGGPGVEFPAEWYEFARICGGHDANTPSRLWAAARPGAGIDLAPLSALAWEHTFD